MQFVERNMYGVCVLICLFATINHSVGDFSTCELMLEFYQILGCNPMNKSVENLCESSFDCPDQLVADKCYTHGKFYDIGEIVPDNYTRAFCTAGCKCVKTSDEPASFECDEICGCDDVDHNCVQQYKDLNSCCEVREICDPVEISKLKKCYLYGKRYHLGEEIHPETEDHPDRCYTCLCTDDFDNTTAITANKNCLKDDCEVPIISQIELRRGCAPVFDKHSCCVMNSQCPNEGDEIESRSTSNEKLDGSVCKFGNLTLQRGEKLKPQHTRYYYTSCACEMPPTLTCKRIKKQDCDD